MLKDATHTHTHTHIHTYIRTHTDIHTQAHHTKPVLMFSARKIKVSLQNDKRRLYQSGKRMYFLRMKKQRLLGSDKVGTCPRVT